MSQRVATLLCVVGCSYLWACGGGSGSQDAAPAGDGDRGFDDGPHPDAAPHCTIDTGLGSGSSSKVGSGGGSQLQGYTCPDNASVVGIALDMSNGPVNGGADRSAKGIQIVCAHVTIDATGGHTDTPTSMTIDGLGSGGFSPSTLTAVAMCPPGGVMSGLQIAEGAGSAKLFQDATISCNVYDLTGAFVSVQQVAVADSGSDAANPSLIQCATNQEVTTLVTEAGNGLNSVVVSCAPIVCD